MTMRYKMKFFLLKMSVVGIKNINKEIELNFYKNTITKNFDVSNSHVKAIYGSNGAGKTGIVYAVDIYKNLVLDSKYLTVCNANGSLDCLINQNTQEFKINMIFLCSIKESENKIFSHFIRIKKLNNEFKIVEEKLSELSGANLNSTQKYSTIYHIIDGKIVDLIKKFKNVKELEMSTMNLLTLQSFACAGVRPYVLNNSKISKADKDLFGPAILLINFVFSITVVLQGTDKFIDYNYMFEQISTFITQHESSNNEAIQSNVFHGKKLSYLDSERVHKSEFGEYEKYIYNLSLFIKVFNEDLGKIEIKKDENGDYYECENIMVYKNKRISEKYESTGIKKLIDLYAALCDLDEGKIVFIDEFDANIHDVLLEKLVQYAMQYAKGQLIFTTHNLGPMDVLQSAKNSIDFLSSDSRIVSWTKNGNYTAASQYKKGLIKYSPFNIEPFSFLGVFGDEQK